MDPFTLFIPLNKADAAQRLVYGVAAAERPDKSGEILDYATAKPAFEAWSGEIAKATDGKSLGNVRLMHTKTAVGKVVALRFDDDAREVEVCAKVVDDQAWAMVEEGVLAGFSIGGGYAKRWSDPNDSSLKRYTPVLSELSLVDNPCIPGATFQMIKADGAIEAIEVQSKFQEAVNEPDELEDEVISTHPDNGVQENPEPEPEVVTVAESAPESTPESTREPSSEHDPELVDFDLVDDGLDPKDEPDAHKASNLHALAKSAADARAEADRLQKTLDALEPELEKLAAERDDLQKRLDHYERQPLPPKGALFALDKDGQLTPLGEPAAAPQPQTKPLWRDRYDELPPGPERAQFLVKHARLQSAR